VTSAKHFSEGKDEEPSKKLADGHGEFAVVLLYGIAPG
jgi:hypothetical protein